MVEVNDIPIANKTYPVPENYAATTLTVSASIPDAEESDVTDNTESIEIGKVDLSVMQTELVNFGNNYILKAVVENNSAVNANGVVVSAIFNDSENEPFEQSEIGTLAKEQYVDYELAFNKELVEFDENGMIKEVPQTSSGAEKALDARNTVHARTACRLMGKCHITVRDGYEVLLSEKGRHWGQRDWAEYKYIDFGEGGLSELCVTACGKGSVSFVIEGNTELCSLVFECDTPQKFTAKIPDVKGVHTLWLFLDGSFTLSDFKFR